MFSYVSILLVGTFAAFTWSCEESRHIIRLGIFFTLIADFFLVVCDDRMLEGVASFLFVQMCYFAYLLVREDRRFVRRWNVISRIALSIALVTAAFAVLGKETDLLSMISVLYYGNLVVNCVFAFLRFKEEKLFAIGLFLFAMCDACIGIDTLFSVYLKSNALDFIFDYPYANVPWIFYQPSQTLIALRLVKGET